VQMGATPTNNLPGNSRKRRIGRKRANVARRNDAEYFCEMGT